MTAVRSAILVGLAFLVGATEMNAHRPIEDPQTLYETTQRALDQGDLERATSTLTSIRLLLEAEPGWDPDGSFSRVLIPDTADRLARLREASTALVALRNELDEEEDPVALAGTDDLARSLGWGTTMAQRAEDGAAQIAESLPPGTERGALLQSKALVETRRVLHARVLPYMAGALSERIVNLLERDEQFGIMIKRMESLKQEVMELNIERRQLQDELAGATEERSRYLRGLVVFIAGDPDSAEVTGEPVVADVESVLARVVRERLLEVKSLDELTLLRKTLLLEESARFRFANKVVVAMGGRNHTGRIDLLATSIERVPVRAGGIDEASMGWLDRLFSKSGQ